MDIIGFDAQVGVVKTFAKAVAKRKMVAPVKVVAKPKPVAPVKSVAPAKTVARPKSVAPVKAVVKPKMVAPVKMVTKKTVLAPVKTSPIVTAKQYAAFKKTTPAQPVKQVSVQSVKSVSTLPSNATPKQIFNAPVTPQLVNTLNSTQRSFLRADLPYQPVTSKTKVVRIKNTPIDLPQNINMIEPPVDGGIADYYGK